MTFDLKIEAVLEKELYGEPPLMPVIVAKISTSSHDIPKAFSLTKEFNTSDLKHLRRVKKLDDSKIECIICSVRSARADCLIKDLGERFASENIFQDYRLVEVPSMAPRTDHQLKACNDIWPCKYAKSEHLNQSIDGSIFSELERLILKVIVNDTLDYIRNNRDTQSVAVVFRYAEVYGVGLSNSRLLSEHPVKHSTMMSIDSVATNAGAGHWQCPESGDLMTSIKKKLDSVEKLKDHTIEADFLPYLCTNYDVFVTEEPCFMCSMGLVQSRIRRLFYLDSKSLDLSVGCKLLCYPDQAIERHLVHRNKNLNHRFEAWRILLCEESD